MAKVIKYGDTSKIESGGEHAPVGLYIGKVAEISQKQSKNDEPMIEVVWELTKDANGKKLKKKYSRVWSYAPLDPESSWARRLKDIVTAFGLKAKGGNIATIEGKEALVRLREDTDQDGEYRPQISKILALKATEAEPDEADEDEDEDEDDASGTGTALDEMDRAALKALIKEEGLEVKVLKSMDDDALREAIVAAGWEDEDAEEEDEEDEEDEDEDEEGDEEEGDEDDEEEDDEEGEEEDNYDDLSLKELRQELKDRDLDTKGKQAVLIARLRADDEEEPV